MAAAFRACRHYIYSFIGLLIPGAVAASVHQPYVSAGRGRGGHAVSNRASAPRYGSYRLGKFYLYKIAVAYTAR